MYKCMTGMLAAATLGLFATTAQAQEKLTIATLLSPEQIAAVWPITNGKVSDPAIDVSVEFVSISASYQALLTKQYDGIVTATAAIPRLAEQGLDIKVIAQIYRYPAEGDGTNIWVMKDSPYQTIADLKGKSIATAALESGGTTAVRSVIQTKYKMNPSSVGGDFDWVELPTPQMRSALKAGQIDSALIPNLEALLAEEDGSFRPILRGQTEWTEVHGSAMPATFIGSYDEKLNARPEAFKALVRLMKASIDYTMANQDEVFGAVAAEAKIKPEDIKVWFDKYGAIPIAITEGDKRGMEAVWKASVDLGILKNAPESADQFVWEGALSE